MHSVIRTPRTSLQLVVEKEKKKTNRERERERERPASFIFFVDKKELNFFVFVFWTASGEPSPVGLVKIGFNHNRMIKGNIKSDRVLKKGKISQPWTISDSSLFPLNITTVFFFTMIAVRQLFSLWEKKNKKKITKKWRFLKKKKSQKKKTRGAISKWKCRCRLRYGKFWTERVAASFQSDTGLTAENKIKKIATLADSQKNKKTNANCEKRQLTSETHTHKRQIKFNIFVSHPAVLLD